MRASRRALSRRLARAGFAVLIVALLGNVLASSFVMWRHNPPSTRGSSAGDARPIPAYRPKAGRQRPVVAVVGENTFTELTDYVVPFAVLSESAAADVVALGTQPGPIEMFPALRIQPQTTIDGFDSRFPDGADYVIVPAVHRQDEPRLLAWVRAQERKSAVVVGVCDGVWVLANAGLLHGRHATGHWYSRNDLRRKFPGTIWDTNRRYVVDGNVITTTGVAASLPVSLALVEAIAGTERARALARGLGATHWSARHDSDAFRLSAPALLTAVSNTLAFWSHETVGIPVAHGFDEIDLALTADAFSRTYRSKAVSISASEGSIRSRHGLTLVPDRISGSSRPPDRILGSVERGAPAQALDRSLERIAHYYGASTAAFVALQLEYPQP